MFSSLWRLPIFLGMLFVVVGCATDVANRLYIKLPPVGIESVELLTDKPNRAFDVVADFQSRGESPNDLRRKAAEVGADAVIVSLLGGYVSTSNEWAASKDMWSKSYTRITGTAIKYK